MIVLIINFVFVWLYFIKVDALNIIIKQFVYRIIELWGSNINIEVIWLYNELFCEIYLEKRKIIKRRFATMRKPTYFFKIFPR